MRLDTLAVRLRARTPVEATDLGVRLCQHAARSVYPCFMVAAVPVFALALASAQVATWLPLPIMWWAKPWLDRTILFVLSRAAFGQPTRVADVWQAQRHVWWRRFWFSWSVRRLSPWRSVTEAVYQLEGMSLVQSGARVRQIRLRHAWSAALMTQTFLVVEAAVLLALLSLVFWFAPAGQVPGMLDVVAGDVPALISAGVPVAYAIAALFLEPFFVAAGFALYLSRRADLEAWDVEQELRRAFAR